MTVQGDRSGWNVAMSLAFTAIAGDTAGESLSIEALRRAVLRRASDLDASLDPKGWSEWREAVLPAWDAFEVPEEEVAKATLDADPLSSVGVEKAHALIEAMRATLNWHQGKLDHGCDPQQTIDRLLEDLVAVMGGRKPRIAPVPGRIHAGLEAAA